MQFGAKPLNDPNHYEVYLRENGFEIPTVKKRFAGKNPGTWRQEMFALHDGPVESCIEYFVAEETIRVMNMLVENDRPFFMDQLLGAAYALSGARTVFLDVQPRRHYRIISR